MTGQGAVCKSPFDILVHLDEACRLHDITMSPAVADAGSELLAISFRLGTHRLFCDITHTQEVIAPPALTRVPRTMPWFMGVANIHGSLAGIVDLRLLLGIPPGNESGKRRIIITQGGSHLLGLAVDEVLGHITVARRLLMPLAERLPERLEPYVLHQLTHSEQTLIHLDLNRLTASGCMADASVTAAMPH